MSKQRESTFCVVTAIFPAFSATPLVVKKINPITKAPITVVITAE
jgi:hypothetical protein